eukprot:7306366-Alexandrium_andersonii.AAC.1
MCVTPLEAATCDIARHGQGRGKAAHPRLRIHASRVWVRTVQVSRFGISPWQGAPRKAFQRK